MPVREDYLQTTSSKHPIPQNVMDVEFKVVGDLTLRQFMYLVAGSILMYIFHRSGLPGFWRWTLIFITGSSTVAIAFVPLQERGLDVWLVNFIKSLINPSQRVWRKSYYTPEYFLADYASIIRNEIVTLTPTKSRNKLAEYLGLIPEDLSELDRREKGQIEQISALIKTSKVVSRVPVTPAPAAIPPTKAEVVADEMASKVEIAEAFTKQKRAIDRKMMNVPEYIKTQEIELPQASGTIEFTPKAKLLPPQKEVEIKTVADDLLKTVNRATKEFKDIIRVEPPVKTNTIDLQKVTNQNSVSLGQTAVYEEINDALKQKQVVYTDTTKPMPVQKATVPITPPSQPQKQPPGIIKEEVVNELPTETALKNIVSKMQQNVNTAKKPITFAPPIPNVNTPNEPVITKQQVYVNQQAPLPPNIIGGVIKGLNSEGLTMTLVLLKNEKGDVVRALNTDLQGNFRVESALPDGKYILDVMKDGLKFDSFAVELTGKPVKPLTIIAKSSS